VNPRRTLAGPVRVEGVGLFTGNPVAAEFLPAEQGGLRVDPGPGPFPATIDHLDRRAAHPAFAAMPARNTALAAGPDRPPVFTVEHALAALAGLGVTDAVVRVTGGELPIGDGSAALFTGPILDRGLRELPGRVAPIVPRARLELVEGPASLSIEPADRPEFRYELDYGPGAPIPPQSASWAGDAEAFAAEIAPARTFCLRAEAEAMHAMGLFRHLTPRDMLVFGDAGPIDNTLRSPDEPARHKLLDLIGDLALAGRPIMARVVARRSGHAMNHEAARRLAALAD